ncbi:MAG: hypothetical protein WD851_23950 [Pirellulales bacterium]
MRRLSIASLLAIPGIVLAMLAKPLVLGEGVLFLGLLLAVALPVSWLIAGKA